MMNEPPFRNRGQGPDHKFQKRRKKNKFKDRENSDSQEKSPRPLARKEERKQPYPGKNPKADAHKPNRSSQESNSQNSFKQRNHKPPSHGAPSKPQGKNQKSFKSTDQKHQRGETRDSRGSKSSRMIKELSQPTEAALKDSKPWNETFVGTKRRYGLAIYDTFTQAKSDIRNLTDLAKNFDQLNLVIRSEGNMDDSELLSIGKIKIFAGAAWTIIHERRKADGWYEEPR